MPCVLCKEASRVEVVEVYDVSTLRIKDGIVSYTCVLADITIPVNIGIILYDQVYNIVYARIKNKLFLCKQKYGYRVVYLYDREDFTLINSWINNLLVMYLG